MGWDERKSRVVVMNSHTPSQGHLANTSSQSTDSEPSAVQSSEQ
jgi:hypothetical protein